MGTETLRASDADRERVVERLRRAQAEGRIDVFEFDERVAAAYAARTYADLEPLTADLPAERRAASARASAPGRHAGAPHAGAPHTAGGPLGLGGTCAGAKLGGVTPGGVTYPDATRAGWPSGKGSVRARRSGGWALARRIELACWLAVSLLNLVIWAAVSVAAGGGVYPWWIWVAGPWGVALVLEHLAGRLTVRGSVAPRG
jgi:Domain of unknown function (DUF1707)